MKVMGIRELKAHISEAIKEVQNGETIEVTRHGKIVAMLVPVRDRRTRQEIEASLESIDQMAADISRNLRAQTDAAQTISDMRR